MALLRASAAVLSSLVILVSMAGCSRGSGASASPTAMAEPSPIAYSLDVSPAMSTGRTIPGARVVFLVTVSGVASDGPVTIKAQAPNAKVKVDPEELLPGTVGEVEVVPIDCTCNNVKVGVLISAQRGSVRQQESRELELVSGADTWATDAAARLAPFITWLEANRPQLGITSQTKWEGTPGSWVLIVEHYLYFSTEWELDLEWHVMVPPDDWARISLRRRGTEVAPSSAFEISSVANKSEPKEITPPDAVWR